MPGFSGMFIAYLLGCIYLMEIFLVLVNEIYEYALRHDTGLKIADIRIGLGYTAVVIEDGRCGLAYTLHEGEYESCCVIPEAGKLSGRSTSELISCPMRSHVLSDWLRLMLSLIHRMGRLNRIYWNSYRFVLTIQSV